MNRLESQIQSSIKKKFERAGWTVVKLIQTTMNGIPDLMCLKNGKTIFIEVKRPGQNPTELQLIRHEQLRKQGFEVLVISDEKGVVI